MSSRQEHVCMCQAGPPALPLLTDLGSCSRPVSSNAARYREVSSQGYIQHTTQQQEQQQQQRLQGA